MRWNVHNYRWHRWFAWRPVRINNQRVWLETVERRWVDGFWVDGFCGDGWMYRNRGTT